MNANIFFGNLYIEKQMFQKGYSQLDAHGSSKALKNCAVLKTVNFIGTDFHRRIYFMCLIGSRPVTQHPKLASQIV